MSLLKRAYHLGELSIKEVDHRVLVAVGTSSIFLTEDEWGALLDLRYTVKFTVAPVEEVGE